MAEPYSTSLPRQNPKADAASAARANSCATYPSVTSWSAVQEKARSNSLDREQDLGRVPFDDVNKTEPETR